MKTDKREFKICVPACPLCRGAWSHYDGALGYESLRCARCGFDIGEIKISIAEQISEEEEARRGALLAEVFGVNKDTSSRGRFLTAWGNKTHLGLYRTAKRIITEGE